MTTTEAKAQDTSYQVHKAACQDCGWTYLSKRNEHQSIAIAKGRVHGHVTGHTVRLKQDIVDIDCERIYPPPSILDRL